MPQLSYEKTVKLLEKYKLPFVKGKLVKTVSQASLAAKRLGYPIVLKAVSPKIIHKTDEGAVKLNILDEEGLEAAFEELNKKAKKKKIKLEGILIQKQEEGIEIIVGMKKDPTFDTVMMFGVGGIFVELFNDVSFRIPPIDKRDALEMINEIKAKEMLEGFRGMKPVNKDVLANLLVKISKLADEKKIEEVDFNPIMIKEDKVMIVDARMIG